MKLKLDENLGARCRRELVQAGHDVETVATQGMCSATDEFLHEVCRTEDRALLTMDLDFANPLRFPPTGTPGLAVVRLPKQPCAVDLQAAIRVFIQAVEKESLPGKLWIVELDRIRVYQPLD